MSTLNKAINGARSDIALGGRPILGVAVLNPTPAYLYLSNLDSVGPESYLACVEPWSMATIPLVVNERLYVIDYGRVEALPNNSRAQVTALSTTPDLALSHIPHSYTRVLFTDTPLVAQGGIQAQSISNPGLSAADVQLPKSARSALILVKATGGTLNGLKVKVGDFPLDGRVTVAADGLSATVNVSGLGAGSVQLIPGQSGGTASGLLLVNI